MNQRNETPRKVPVSMRALIQRINRKYEADEGGDPRHMYLKKSRPGTVRDLGEYYLLDGNTNSVKYLHVNPEKLGREIGVLADWEEVVADT